MIWTASSAFVGLVLLLAGVPKVLTPRAFTRVVRGFGVLPGPLVAPVARVVPVVEVLAGAALVTGFLVPPAAALAAALFTAFTAALALNLARGRRDIDCGCFGFTRSRQDGEVSRIGPWHAVRAGSLAVAAVAAAVLAPAGATAAERGQGAAAAALVLLLVVVATRVVGVVNPGRTRVDTHLARASVRYREALRRPVG